MTTSTDASTSETTEVPADVLPAETTAPESSTSTDPWSGSTSALATDAPFAKRESAGRARHLVSLVVSCVAVLVGYAGLDYALTQGLTRPLAIGQDAAPSSHALIGLAVALAGLFVAAAAGRLSAFGPFVAGVVLAGLPAAWALLRPVGLAHRLTDLPNPYSHAGDGLAANALLVFGLAAALLLGTAVAASFHPRRR